MIGFSILQDLFSKIIATGHVKQVFHSVIIRPDNTGNRKPSAPVGNKFVYVGIDDSKGFLCYCRAIGPLETVKVERISSLVTEYTVQQLNRLVFYNEFGCDHDTIAGQLVKIVMSSNETKFVRLYTDADDIIRQEQPTGTFNLPTSALYIAIEFHLTMKLIKDECEVEISSGLKNPFC